MEETNVNNLNGVPNFGHGLPETNEVPVEAPVETVEAAPEEVVAPEVEAEAEPEAEGAAEEE